MKKDIEDIASMVPQSPLLSLEARGPRPVDRVAAAEVPWSDRMKKVKVFLEYF